MCAIRAGQRGRRVLVLDHADKVGKKILISGGGRCNFTNLRRRPEAFLSANPHFCKSALARYTQHDFIALVEQAPHRLAREDPGPAVLRRLGARRSSPCCWPNARRPASTCGWRIASPAIEQGRSFHGRAPTRATSPPPSLVLATGGLSIPKMGATGFALRHRPPLRPGADRDAARRWCRSRSTRLPDAEPACRSRSWRAAARPSFREAMLFTHRGLSGPAILQISSYWREGEEIVDRPAARHRCRPPS